ncbi:MAG: NYN domain-containing protein [Verrucomicrobia bacterium 61-8]|nr:MAG: NYN domain-containing protein [Verrucomicrobia bacterium 61-8]
MSDSTTPDATMAVFLDLENVALGAKEAAFERFSMKLVNERLLLRGHIVVKKAYCDFDRYKEFKRDLHEEAFELIEIPHVRQSGKNSADIRMVVDALDLCYTKPHLDTFVIVSGDSDFSPLVSKLRENNKTVIGVGVKKSSSDLFINNCDEFLYYDDFARRKKQQQRPRVQKPAAKPQEKPAVNEGPTKEQAFEQLVSTMEALTEERGDDPIYASMVKPALKRLNPGFSERAHGFSSFNELLKAAKAARLVELDTEGKASNNYGVRLVREA